MPHRYRAARTNGTRSDEHQGGRGPPDRQRPPEHPGGDAPVADDAPRPAAARDAPGVAEERFRRYFELGLIGMAITSPAKGCIEVNDEICNILGYERSELLGLTWVELTHPDDLAADVANFERVMAGELEGYSMDK